MTLRTCVTFSGGFRYGIHKPAFRVTNLRGEDFPASLGSFPEGTGHENRANLPEGDVEEPAADTIFEIPNPFPFKGTTYISSDWADTKAVDPALVGLPEKPSTSLSESIREWLGAEAISDQRLDRLFRKLPEPILLALAVSSSDPLELMQLAHLSCKFVMDSKSGRPVGLRYQKGPTGLAEADIINHSLFESVANNVFLPDGYKRVMVLTPGVQGNSEIMGHQSGRDCRVFEYLRRNSYIPWGHYAANMADDCVRYRIGDLSLTDMESMRHLYYQRTYVRMADQVGLPVPGERKSLVEKELEALRCKVRERMAAHTGGKAFLKYNATLWGWNFGYDFSPSKYRLNASHQQIHQQFALIPAMVEDDGDTQNDLTSFSCGDLVADFARDFKKQSGNGFFDTYITAIHANRRMDNSSSKENSLVVHEDSHVMIFVPKAQTSQWELQLMALEPVGNIMEADTAMRSALDRGILMAVKLLESLGARMFTVFEYSKRFDSRDSDQRLLYTFLPRIPQSPGGFSEAQLRWITGHYPEDFAAACRLRLEGVLETISLP
jgi:hypothetical protein